MEEKGKRRGYFGCFQRRGIQSVRWVVGVEEVQILGVEVQILGVEVQILGVEVQILGVEVG